MKNSFRVLPFNPDSFKEIVIEKSHKQQQNVGLTPRVLYLEKYLEAIGSATIIVEEEYIDRDFLKDFSIYYAQCFENYSKTCSRLHFFKSDFNKEKFLKILEGEEKQTSLQENYLGFVVIKPLPLTVIGRTCLISYPNDDTHKRYFPALNEITAHLFGIELTVLSQPFQEQDNGVASCVGISLWSIFQNTGKLFQHSMPSSGEITLSAIPNSLVDRIIPSEYGFTFPKIEEAIRSVGLEPYTIWSIENVRTLQLSVLAYLRVGIPCLLLSKSVDKNREGGHAVAINGYRFGESDLEDEECSFLSSKVDRFYCHDDQIGPFSKLEIDPNGDIHTMSPYSEKFYPAELLIIPLYHKIRIPASKISDIAVQFNKYLKIFPNFKKEKIVWDVILTTVNDFKKSLFDADLKPEMRSLLLQKSYPKYLWKIVALRGGKERFNVILDATGLSQETLAIAFVPNDYEFCRELVKMQSRVAYGEIETIFKLLQISLSAKS